MRTEKPIEVILDDHGQATLVSGTYEPQNSGRDLVFGCGLFLVVYVVFPMSMLGVISLFPQLQWILQDGVADLVGGLLGVVGVVLFVLFTIVRRWWGRARVELDATGLAHGEWALAWDQIEDVVADQLSWPGEARQFPAVVVVTQGHAGWALPVRTPAEAERFAATLQQAKPRTNARSSERRSLPQRQPE